MNEGTNAESGIGLGKFLQEWFSPARQEVIPVTQGEEGVGDYKVETCADSYFQTSDDEDDESWDQDSTCRPLPNCSVCGAPRGGLLGAPFSAGTGPSSPAGSFQAWGDPWTSTSLGASWSVESSGCPSLCRSARSGPLLPALLSASLTSWLFFILDCSYLLS